jgi:hypothetical protein
MITITQYFISYPNNIVQFSQKTLLLLAPLLKSIKYYEKNQFQRLDR